MALQEHSTCGCWGKSFCGVISFYRHSFGEFPLSICLSIICQGSCKGEEVCKGHSWAKADWKGPAASILLEMGQTTATCPSCLLKTHWIIPCTQGQRSWLTTACSVLEAHLQCQGSVAGQNELSPSSEARTNRCFRNWSCPLQGTVILVRTGFLWHSPKERTSSTFVCYSKLQGHLLPLCL